MKQTDELQCGAGHVVGVERGKKIKKCPAFVRGSPCNKELIHVRYIQGNKYET